MVFFLPVLKRLHTWTNSAQDFSSKCQN